MLLVTWNVNSLKARLPRLLELLEEQRPDVVCLQETKAAAGTTFPLELAAAGYTAVGHGAGRWTGVALLAGPGRALVDVRAGLPGEPRPDEARWLEATVAGIRVVSVYVPNGRAVGTSAFAEKLAFMEAAAARLDTLRGRPLLLAGDLNVAPGDLDLYDPAAFTGATHVTAEERGRLARLLEDGGLVDAWRHLYPEEPGFTWWDYRAGHFHRGLGMRIDLVLLARQLAPRVAACRVAREYRKGPSPSDHAPLLLTLRD
ncbi:MAG TPA: exodeoxyribonuclease III [Actinomycetes bacterium]|nr:exodeoxyribonuclease III [Actinomycetes bacterium]